MPLSLCYNEAMEPKHFEALYPPTAREKELAMVIRFIKEGNSCQLIGLLGTGRSTTLGLLAYNKRVREHHLGKGEKRYHFVLINFTEVRKRPLHDATKLIFLTLVDSLKDRGLTSLYTTSSEILKESLSYHDELILFQGLKKTIDLLCLENELTVVFLFDKFEHYLPMLTDSFFTNLRLLRDRAKYHFSVIFCLTKPMDDLVEPLLLSDFKTFFIGHSVFLALEDAESLSFQLSYLQKVAGETLPATLIKRIHTLTGGHPRLTRLCAESALSANTDITEKKEEDLVSFFLSEKSIFTTCEEIFNSLNPAEQTHVIKKLFKSVLDDEHSKYLEHIGLFQKDTIAIPLFTAFIEKYHPASSLETTTQLTYEKETDDILKGTESISDTLTRSEFRMLRFFLQNINTTLNRDQIINAVWKNTASTEGVTDQALDQVIFRLRRKIEEDPNKPRHIITVKGRGFKFTP